MDHPALENRLQSEIDTLVSKNKDVFNVVLGITNIKGDFYWSGAAGTAYADQTEAMKVDTPIFIASITKMYTSAVTMILEERDRLSLDDPISKFLPNNLCEGLHRYKGFDYSDQLKIYHLVSQTSGLPDYFMEKPQSGQSMFDRLIADGDMGWEVADVVDIAKNISPKFQPESKDQAKYDKKAYYSDTNYQLLGSVLESVAHKPLQDIFTEYIIEPLELTSTYLHGYSGTQTTPGIQPANIYYKTKALYLDKAMTSFGPDGGLVSNIEDSLKFLKSLLEGKLFVDPSTLERMKSWRKIFFPFQYGLGLMRFQLPKIFSPFSPNPELIGHSGSTSAFLFYSDIGQLYIGGTLNQIENQGRPFRLMLKIIKILDELVS
ncbi:MAG: serine hydrolase domain-containing protein [Anaerolineales bacterium]